MEEYYTVQQASKLLGISVSSFKKAVYAGKYPYGICKIGSTRRYWSKRDLGLLNEEMWKPVVSYEGLYEVSNIGRIRNIRGKLVKQSMTVSGYKRVTLRKNNIATARYVLVDESEKRATCDKIEHFPIMVKPCDCNSSKGVVKVNDKKELLAALNEAFILSRTNQAVIEEYIDGIEISIDAWVENGCAKVLSISKTNKIKENINAFTIFQSEYPVILTENIKKQIYCVAEQISKVFRLNNSPLLIQAIVSGDKLYVIEFSARMGGGSKYKLIEYMTGINIMEAYVNLILGSAYQIPDANLSSKYIELGYVYCHNGTISRIIGFDKLKNAGVISEIFQYKLEGACIEKMVTSSDRILGFLIEADTKECLLEKRKYILKQVDILGMHNQSLMFKKCFE